MRPLLALGLLLALAATAARAQESGEAEETGVGLPVDHGQAVGTPMPDMDPRDQRDQDALLRDATSREVFRRSLAARLVPIRAVVVPPPPFDPGLPATYHGVAVPVLLAGKKRWLTSGPLVEEATRVEARSPSGRWYAVKARILCRAADFAVIEGIRPPDLSTLGRTDWFKGARFLTVREARSLHALLPVVAVTNLEGSAPVLEGGHLIRRLDKPQDRGWLLNLRLAPGTPALSARGEVLTLRVARGILHMDVSPEAEPYCAPAKPDGVD